jgi:DNA-binding transcriptional MerR regulator
VLVPEPQWRIDEIAQKAGLTVDTIRYYAREDLLMAPERSGRHKLYGQDHLDRLNRIRELQEQRFSLAAIRAILNVDRPGLEDLFATKGHSYCFDDLVERSGLDPELVGRLRDVGLLADPVTLGHDAYDDNDLGLLRSVVELQEIGMTEEVLVALGKIYVHHFRALQADVHAMLAGHDRDWDPDELVAIQRNLTANSQRMVPAVDRVLNYVHQRTIQRLTLEAVRTAEATGTGVGGVRVTDE